MQKRASKPADLRQTIATKVKELRVAHHFTQGELAKRLDISQSRLSEIERGGGSFTAEQFLELLRLFNVTAAHFVESRPDRRSELQNALARLGATQLHESSVIASGDLIEAHDVVREALLDGGPRVITALAPVLVLHAQALNLPKLYAELHELGLERRLGWVVENTSFALGTLARESGVGAKGWQRLKRFAEVPFHLFADVVATHAGGPGVRGAVDVLDPTIRSVRTLEDVQTSASDISKRWRIATRLQPADFVQALRASRAAG